VSVFVVAGCTTTPKIDSVPGPEISSEQIDTDSRRPVPVFEQSPDAQDAAKAESAEGESPALSQPPTYSDRSTATSQTVLALLDQAQQQERSGRPERAAAVLERALRIDPKNARLWHRLAMVRYNQGQFSLAASLAAKSSALAQGDWHLKQQNDELIRKVRQQAGYR
jgi:Flp pilus assembly protein TadD